MSAKRGGPHQAGFGQKFLYKPMGYTLGITVLILSNEQCKISQFFGNNGKFFYNMDFIYFRLDIEAFGNMFEQLMPSEKHLMGRPLTGFHAPSSNMETGDIGDVVLGDQ